MATQTRWLRKFRDPNTSSRHFWALAASWLSMLIISTPEGFVELPPHPNGDGVHRYHAWRWSRRKIARESRELIVLPTRTGRYEIYTKRRDYARRDMTAWAVVAEPEKKSSTRASLSGTAPSSVSSSSTDLG